MDLFTVVVGADEYGVMAHRRWELHDEVHSYSFPEAVRDIQGFYGRSGVSLALFAGTCIAALDVLGDK